MNELQEFNYILVIEDRKGRRIISLDQDVYTLGRDSHNSIVIYDYQVSRVHAHLTKVKDEDDDDIFSYCIIDGDLQGKRSTNGLLVNGKVIATHELKHGDTIRFGDEVKANYYIIAKESGIDLFNLEDLAKLNLGDLSVEESQQTVIGKPEEEINPDDNDQEELIRLASFPELSPNPIIEIDWKGNLTYINPAASIKFESIYDEKIDHPILSGLLSEDNNRQGNLFLREVKIGSEVFEQYVHYLSEKKLIRSYIYDFTKRKQVEASFKESEARYRAILRQTSEGIFLAYANKKMIIQANKSACDLLGYTEKELKLFTLYDIIGKDIQSFSRDLEKILKDKQDLISKYTYTKQNGKHITLESNISLISIAGKEIFCFVVRRLDQKQLRENSFTSHLFQDLLTQLPNQKLFNEQLNIAIANAKRYQYLMAIVVIKIENLSELQDSDKDNENEEILKNFVESFKSCLRSGDFPARWDENKFIALLSRIRGPKDPAKIAKRMSEVLKQSVHIGDKQIELKLNIGIVVYPLDGEDSTLLMDNAFNYLEQNKNSPANNYGISGFTITAKTATLLKLENSLNQAIKEQKFFLAYQPQINCETRQITGIEALLKWEDSDLFQLAPRHFFKLAEETDLMLPLSKWVLKTACMQNKAWMDAGLSNLSVGVNLFFRQFQELNLGEVVKEILEESSLPPDLLELEVPETCLIQNQELVLQTILNLSEMGVKICLDNFGSGNLSLNYLEKFNFNTLKISNKLIADINKDERKKTLISAITTLGKGFNVRMVAEGVEISSQMDSLVSLNCSQIQGNLFSRPLAAPQATNFLKRDSYNISQ